MPGTGAMAAFPALPADIPEEWHAPLIRAGLTVLGHPLDYAKVLIQIGHEPVAPRHVRKALTGKPALALPSIFQYMGYLRRRDGFLGLYRGCGIRVLGVGAEHLATKKVRLALSGVCATCLDDPESKVSALPGWAKESLREAVERTIVIVLTHPLHVCAVRCMAQFVGGEAKYDNVVSALASICKDDGFLGLWSGLVPRVVGEVTCLGLTALLTHWMDSLLADDENAKTWTRRVASFLASSFCYPFVVVSNCMAVSRSGLAAGYPPHMPLYRDWFDCWSHLSSRNQLKRGSSLLFRYYTGPQVIVGERALPVDDNSVFFKSSRFTH